jgi:hypothetical protein
MKIPILLTIVILAIAAMLGWRNHRELGQSRETQTRLLDEARALGLDPRPLPGPMAQRLPAGGRANPRATAPPSPGILPAVWPSLPVKSRKSKNPASRRLRISNSGFSP